MIKELIRELLQELLKKAAGRPARWPAIMSREVAAEYCNMSVSTFDHWVRAGRLPPPLPGSRRWSQFAIDRYILNMDGGSELSGPNDEVMLLDRWMEKNGV